MSDQATPGPLPPPPRSNHGCLWGCLIAGGIALAAIIAAVSYGGWYLYSGFKHNETIIAVTLQLNTNSTARAVLGDKIEVTNLSNSSFNTTTETGTDEAYVAKVKGSKAEGTLSIKAKTPPGGTRHITELKLTGPDGRTYDLLRSGGDMGGASPGGSTGGGMHGGATTPPANGGDDGGATGGDNGGTTSGDSGGASGGEEGQSSTGHKHGGGSDNGDSSGGDDNNGSSTNSQRHHGNPI